MNTATVNFKTEPEVKARAQKTAENLGFTLSSVLNAFLKQFIRTKTVHFSDREPEVPTQYFLDAIKTAKKDWKEGNVSPTFDNIKDNLDWLKKQGI